MLPYENFLATKGDKWRKKPHFESCLTTGTKRLSDKKHNFLKIAWSKKAKLAATVPDNALDSAKNLTRFFVSLKEKDSYHTAKRDFLTAATIRLKKKINFLTKESVLESPISSEIHATNTIKACKFKKKKQDRDKILRALQNGLWAFIKLWNTISTD